MNHPKLRDSKKLKTQELYELSQIPEDIIKKIGAHVVYMLHTSYSPNGRCFEKYPF